MCTSWNVHKLAAARAPYVGVRWAGRGLCDSCYLDVAYGTHSQGLSNSRISIARVGETRRKSSWQTRANEARRYAGVLEGRFLWGAGGEGWPKGDK